MRPVFPRSDIEDRSDADAVASGSGTMGFVVQKDVSDLFLCEASRIVALASGCHPIPISIFGVVEMTSGFEMVDVDASFVSTNDMSDDFVFRDSTFVPNPDKTRDERFSAGTVNDKYWSPVSAVTSGPFYAAGISWSGAKVRDTADQRIAARPVVSNASEFATG